MIAEGPHKEQGPGKAGAPDRDIRFGTFPAFGPLV